MASISIRALNEAAHLPRLFDGIARQTRKPDKIVLVDSGSTDASVGERVGARVVRAFRVHLRARPQRRVRGGVGRSSRVRQRPPADEHWLERLTAPLEAPDDVALVYGRQTGDERSAFSELEIMRRWFPPETGHPFCNNANCALRASVRTAYDEELTGLEDIAWVFRIQQDDLRIRYEADAVVVHVHEEGFSRIVNRYRREAHKRIFGNHRMYMPETVGLFFANTVRGYLAAVSRRRLLVIPRYGLRDHASASSSARCAARHGIYRAGQGQKRAPARAGEFPAGIHDFAEAFVALQKVRQEADYALDTDAYQDSDILLDYLRGKDNKCDINYRECSYLAGGHRGRARLRSPCAVQATGRRFGMNNWQVREEAVFKARFGNSVKPGFDHEDDPAADLKIGGEVDS